MPEMTEKPVTPDTWLMIVNPNAGVKKGARQWPHILEYLQAEEIPFHHRMTRKRGDAIVYAQEAVKQGYRRIAVVGGDGTLNEVLNGLYNQSVCEPKSVILGMIPVGTGNDWCREFGISFHYHEAVQQIKKCITREQDTGKVVYHDAGGIQERYFMNVAGMGYDALVAKKTNLLKEKGRGGPLTYLWFVFASLFQYRFMDAVIEVDGQTSFKGEIFSMNVGICRYNGGGMMQVPDAIPDDGLLDLTLIVKAPKWIVVRHANKLYNGSLVNLPVVRTFRGSTIRMRSTGRIYLETDGESLGHTPFEYTILPRSLTVVVDG